MSGKHLFQRQRGSVLIVSMVVLALISAMSGRMVYQVRLELQIQQQANVLTGLRAVARGAAHQFAGFLSAHVEEASNGPTLPWWIEEGGLAPLTLSGGEAVLIAGFPPAPALANETDRRDDQDSEEDEETEDGQVDSEYDEDEYEEEEDEEEYEDCE